MKLSIYLTIAIALFSCVLADDVFIGKVINEEPTTRVLADGFNSNIPN